MPQHRESQEQRQFVQRVRMDPRTKRLPCCAVPNGGRRGIIEAKIMKAEGVSRGVPDWLCFWPVAPCHGLALEFKNPNGKGRMTPEQQQWHTDLRDCHWRVSIVTSAEAAWTVLMDYLGYPP